MGPGSSYTLRLVRAMVEAGSAQIVLGNHEFNVVAYATLDPARRGHCRPHSEKNSGQHEAFLSDVPFGSPLHRSIIDWLMTIPMPASTSTACAWCTPAGVRTTSISPKWPARATP